MDVAAQLAQRFCDLATEANEAFMENTRIGYLAAAEKAKEAAVAADLGGAHAAECHRLLADCLIRLGNMADAARAACSSLQAARASGNRSFLVMALGVCGAVAKQEPDEMAKAEKESREQERLGGSPSYDGLDLSQEGRIILPTTLADLSRLDLIYYEAAVAICDAALTAAGGRGSAADDDEMRVPSLVLEAEARGDLGLSLHLLRSEGQRGLDLTRQAVVLLRKAVRTPAPAPSPPL